MSGITIFFLGSIAAVFFGPSLLRFWNKWQQQKAFAVDLANVRLIQGPRLIASESECDPTVLQRAETLKGLLALSDNQWITADDIVVRVYTPFADGKTRMTFDAWRTAVEQEFSTICAKRFAKINSMGDFKHALHGQRTNGQN